MWTTERALRLVATTFEAAAIEAAGGAAPGGDGGDERAATPAAAAASSASEEKPPQAILMCLRNVWCGVMGACGGEWGRGMESSVLVWPSIRGNSVSIKRQARLHRIGCGASHRSQSPLGVVRGRAQAGGSASPRVGARRGEAAARPARVTSSRTRASARRRSEQERGLAAQRVRNGRGAPGLVRPRPIRADGDTSRRGTMRFNFVSASVAGHSHMGCPRTGCAPKGETPTGPSRPLGKACSDQVPRFRGAAIAGLTTRLH